MKPTLRDLGFFLLLAAVPASAWLLLFRPEDARNAAIARLIEARQTRLEALQQVVKNIGELREEVGRLTSAARTFDARLTSPKDVDKILDETAQLAQANRLTTKEIHTLEPCNDGKGPVQPIAIHLEGDFAGLQAFLVSLEQQRRVVRIRGLFLTTSEQDPGGRIQASLVLAAYLGKDSS